MDKEGTLPDDDGPNLERVNAIAISIQDLLAFKNRQECVEALGIVLASIFVDGVEKKEVTFSLSGFNDLIKDFVEYYVEEFSSKDSVNGS